MRTVVKTIAAGAFAAMLGIATQASAVFITVAEEGGWTGSDNANDTFTGAPADNITGVDGTTGRSTTAGWFTNSTPKSLLILNFFSQTLDVSADGTPSNFLIATLQQDNAIISSTEADPPIGPFYVHILDFAAEFRILNADAGDAVLFADDPTGSVRHTETSNLLAINPGCTSQDASLNAAGSVCDDIYSFTLSLDEPVPFEIDGVTYTFDFAVVPRVGTVIGADGRIYTPELLDNAIDIIVTIQAVVPEPGTLGLLGLALVGLGFAVRRNKTA